MQVYVWGKIRRARVIDSKNEKKPNGYDELRHRVLIDGTAVLTRREERISDNKDDGAKGKNKRHIEDRVDDVEDAKKDTRKGDEEKRRKDEEGKKKKKHTFFSLSRI